jgi:hypothetical protein
MTQDQQDSIDPELLRDLSSASKGSAPRDLHFRLACLSKEACIAALDATIEMERKLEHDLARDYRCELARKRRTKERHEAERLLALPDQPLARAVLLINAADAAQHGWQQSAAPMATQRKPG